MNQTHTYSITKGDKVLQSNDNSIQRAYIIAATLDNFYGRFETNEFGQKELHRGINASPIHINELEEGLKTVDEFDTALNERLIENLDKGIFHSRYFDVSVIEVEIPEHVITADEQNQALETELDLAAKAYTKLQSENQQLQDQVNLLMRANDEANAMIALLKKANDTFLHGDSHKDADAKTNPEPSKKR